MRGELFLETRQIPNRIKEEMDQQRESGLSGSSGDGSQLSILGQGTRELKEIENETTNTLEHIMMLKTQDGATLK